MPALALQFESLLPQIDFLSVGSNDLVQFLFASDRGNPRLEGRYDTLSPAFLRYLERVCAECDAGEVDLTVCGEMAGDPVAAMALIGIGYRRLSMSPANLGPVKAAIRSMRVSDIEDYLHGQLRSPRPSIRSHLIDFARDHGVEV